jgi:hypothetical protein
VEYTGVQSPAIMAQNLKITIKEKYLYENYQELNYTELDHLVFTPVSFEILKYIEFFFLSFL